MSWAWADMGSDWAWTQTEHLDWAGFGAGPEPVPCYSEAARVGPGVPRCRSVAPNDGAVLNATNSMRIYTVNVPIYSH